MAKEIKYFDSEEVKAARRINAAFAKKMFRGVSNLNFSKTDDLFRTTCDLLGIEPTPRQASKWRNKQGKAWNNR